VCIHSFTITEILAAKLHFIVLYASSYCWFSYKSLRTPLVAHYPDTSSQTSCSASNGERRNPSSEPSLFEDRKSQVNAKSTSKTDTIFLMRFHDQVLSEQDFEQLPAALRRKVSDNCDSPLRCPRVGLPAGHPRAARRLLENSLLLLIVLITSFGVAKSIRSSKCVKVWRACCRWNGRDALWLFRVEDAIAVQPNGDGGPAARRCLALSPAAPTFPLELPRESRAR